LEVDCSFILVVDDHARETGAWLLPRYQSWLLHDERCELATAATMPREATRCFIVTIHGFAGLIGKIQII